jgi:hypothetical protein
MGCTVALIVLAGALGALGVLISSGPSGAEGGATVGVPMGLAGLGILAAVVIRGAIKGSKPRDDTTSSDEADRG